MNELTPIINRFGDSGPPRTSSNGLLLQGACARHHRHFRCDVDLLLYGNDVSSRVIRTPPASVREEGNRGPRASIRLPHDHPCSVEDSFDVPELPCNPRLCAGWPCDGPRADTRVCPGGGQEQNRVRGRLQERPGPGAAGSAGSRRGHVPARYRARTRAWHVLGQEQCSGRDDSEAGRRRDAAAGRRVPGGAGRSGGRHPPQGQGDADRHRGANRPQSVGIPGGEDGRRRQLRQSRGNCLYLGQGRAQRPLAP